MFSFRIVKQTLAGITKSVISFMDVRQFLRLKGMNVQYLQLLILYLIFDFDINFTVQLTKTFTVYKTVIPLAKHLYIKNFKNRKGFKTSVVFSPNLFNRYMQEIPREFGVLLRFINGGYKLNNVRYADNTVMLADSERKIQEILHKLVKERIYFNYKKN